MLAEEKGFSERAVEIAECLFDVNLASTSLAYAGATITHASHHCKKKHTESEEEHSEEEEENEECPLATTEIFSIFAAIASFISSGISECPALQISDKAMCSASVSKLLASLAEVGIAGKLISEACNGNSDELPAPDEAAEHRRLTDEGNEDPAPEPAAAEHEEGVGHLAEGTEEAHEVEHEVKADRKKLGIAECSIKAASAVFFLGKAAADIVHASRHCPKGGEGHEGEEGHEGVSDLACSVAVQNSIGALGTVSNTLATVAMDCARTVSIKTRCAVDVTKLITALVEVAASATGIHVECVAEPHEAEPHEAEPHEAGEHSGEVEHRRLHN